MLRRTQRGGDLRDDLSGLEPEKKKPAAKSKAKAKGKAKSKSKAAKPVDAKADEPGSAECAVPESKGDVVAAPVKRGRGRGGRGNPKNTDAKKGDGRGRGRGRGGRGCSGASAQPVEISDNDETGRGLEVSEAEIAKPVMKRPAACKPAMKARPKVLAEDSNKKAKRTTFAGRRCPEGEIPKARFQSMMETYASMIAPQLGSPSQCEACFLDGLQPTSWF